MASNVSSGDTPFFFYFISSAAAASSICIRRLSSFLEEQLIYPPLSSLPWQWQLCVTFVRADCPFTPLAHTRLPSLQFSLLVSPACKYFDCRLENGKMAERKLSNVSSFSLAGNAKTKRVAPSSQSCSLTWWDSATLAVPISAQPSHCHALTSVRQTHSPVAAAR